MDRSGGGRTDRISWRPLRRWGAGAVPAGVRPWLADGASLTRRLRRLCPAGFRVRLLAQGWARPHPEERRRLGLPPGRLAWVREVELLCGGRPWVRARTVIPRATWRAGRGVLARLGERPLGSRLFPRGGRARGGARRLAVEAAPVGPGLWGRRSLLLLAGRPLLVTEVFLPALGGAGEGEERPCRRKG